MNENDLPRPDGIGENPAGVGGPSLEQVEQRARELAIIDGRTASEVNDDDRDQARKDLVDLAGSGMMRKEEDPLPTTRGEAPGTRGTMTSTHLPQDEARLDEKLAAEGVDEAAHDQMLKAREEEIEGNEG